MNSTSPSSQHLQEELDLDSSSLPDTDTMDGMDEDMSYCSGTTVASSMFLCAPDVNESTKTPPPSQDPRLRTSFALDNSLYQKPKKDLPSLAASDSNQIAPVFSFGWSQIQSSADDSPLPRNSRASRARRLAAPRPRAPPNTSAPQQFALVSNSPHDHVREWLSSHQPALRTTRLQQIESNLQIPGAWDDFQQSNNESEQSSGTTVLVPESIYEDSPPERRPSRTLITTQQQQAQPREGYGFTYSQISNNSEKQSQPVQHEGYGFTHSQLSITSQQQQASSQPAQCSRPPQQGYGFTYSQISTIPDTEAPSTPSFSSQPHPSQATQEEPITQQSQQSHHLLNPDSSFPDNLVYRPLDTDTYSFHAPNPPLPCTSATITSTLQMQSRASTLLRYAESETIYASLSNRIERMLAARIAACTTERGILRQGEKVPSVNECCLRLRNWLVEQKGAREELGECGEWLKHEVEWAEWFVRASECGVLHLKVEGCGCRPEWTRRWGIPLRSLEEG